MASAGPGSEPVSSPPPRPPAPKKGQHACRVLPSRLGHAALVSGPRSLGTGWTWQRRVKPGASGAGGWGRVGSVQDPRAFPHGPSQDQSLYSWCAESGLGLVGQAPQQGWGWGCRGGNVLTLWPPPVTWGGTQSLQQAGWQHPVSRPPLPQPSQKRRPSRKAASAGGGGGGGAGPGCVAAESFPSCGALGSWPPWTSGPRVMGLGIHGVPGSPRCRDVFGGQAASQQSRGSRRGPLRAGP